MKSITIKYSFTFADKTHEVFHLDIDGQSLELISNPPEIPPDWTRLGFHQCPHCPLDSRAHPHCPLSLNLVNIVRYFDRILSYDEIQVEILTEDRCISQKTTAQRGASSLMGIIIATSGCPHTVFFKPMARFHLPFANEEETLYRAASMYLLAQYFLQQDGKSGDFTLQGLRTIYDHMQMVNISVAERLRAASKSDTSVNSIVLLNLHAQAMPYVIEESLGDLRYLFDSYFKAHKEPHQGN
ncbi:MAG: hypothetical protein KKD44_15560 [Proteobacteria bacterium]|nr:hypothetical protein [Pseudomonadota bacterium]